MIWEQNTPLMEKGFRQRYVKVTALGILSENKVYSIHVSIMYAVNKIFIKCTFPS